MKTILKSAALFVLIAFSASFAFAQEGVIARLDAVATSRQQRPPSTPDQVTSVVVFADGSIEVSTLQKRLVQQLSPSNLQTVQTLTAQLGQAEIITIHHQIVCMMIPTSPRQQLSIVSSKGELKAVWQTAGARNGCPCGGARGRPLAGAQGVSPASLG